MNIKKNRLYKTYRAFQSGKVLFYCPSLNRVFWCESDQKATKKFQGHKDVKKATLSQAFTFVLFNWRSSKAKAKDSFPKQKAIQKTPDEQSVSKLVSNAVKGGLKDVISTHGPVDKGNMSSAQKRIVGQVMGTLKSRGLLNIQ